MDTTLHNKYLDIPKPVSGKFCHPTICLKQTRHPDLWFHLHLLVLGALGGSKCHCSPARCWHTPQLFLWRGCHHLTLDPGRTNMGIGAPPSKIYIYISICGLTFTLLNWEESGPCKVHSWPAWPVEQDCRAKISYPKFEPLGVARFN